MCLLLQGVGNTLKRHYETYLLEYELAHDDVDGECCLLCHRFVLLFFFQVNEAVQFLFFSSMGACSADYALTSSPCKTVKNS